MQQSNMLIKYNYGVVRDLCGHGVGLKFHEKPDITHYGKKGYRNASCSLVWCLPIEPMINMGTWQVFLDSEDPFGWEIISGDELPSAQLGTYFRDD